MDLSSGLELHNLISIEPVDLQLLYLELCIAPADLNLLTYRYRTSLLNLWISPADSGVPTFLPVESEDLYGKDQCPNLYQC